MIKKSIYLVIISGFIFMAACSPSSVPATAVEQEATPLPTSTPLPPTTEPTDTAPAPLVLPDTPSSVALGEAPNTTYKLDMQTFESFPFEQSELPAAPGSVTAQWYRSGGRYVVAYVGLDVTDLDTLCPGNSILTNAGFLHVSNSPLVEGACEGFPTLTDDPQVGPIVCQDTLFYATAIPSDETGELFGTLEALAGEGVIIGMTSSVQSSPDIPEIDLDDLCG